MMRGMRPIDEAEIAASAVTFTGRHRHRNRCLLLWLYYTGWRISELLSLTWSDVLLPGGSPQRWVNLRRCNRKGRREGARIPVTAAMAAEIEAYRDAEHNAGAIITGSRRIWEFNRKHAWTILSTAYAKAGIGRKGIGCHGVRKGHGTAIYNAAMNSLRNEGAGVDPMRAASCSLGHRSVASTEHYLPFDDQFVWDAREQMSISTGQFEQTSENGP